MKKISMVLAAVALVLGLSQCKKQEQPTSNADGTVAITLDVRSHDGSRINVNPNNGMVAFEYGDVVYVASGEKFVGTLTNNGATFAGNLTNPTEDEPLYFFFLGNKTPEETLTPGSSTTCSVNISDQTNGYPVISFATSNETFTGAGLYTAYFLNKAALVKFDVKTFSSAPTCILGLNNKVTVDFSTNTFDYSQVDDGLVKLSGGRGERWAILLPQSALPKGNKGSVYTEDRYYVGTRPAIPAITPNDYLNEGIALTVSLEGALDGLFTINANGDRVYFSQGNLQYHINTGKWSFMEHQYDMVEYLDQNVGVNYANQNIVSLFGWGTSGISGYSPIATCYQPWSTSIDDRDYYAYGDWAYNLYDQTGQADWGYNKISNGGDRENSGWRTLTKDEWNYVFNTRDNAASLFGHGNVNGVNGMIFLPDEWTLPEGLSFTSGNSDWINVYSAEQWALMEANGAVFLPAAGYRSRVWVDAVGRSGYYCSASSTGSAAYCVGFRSSELNPNRDSPRCSGQSVRLVGLAAN
jgi:hypothetical protein